MYDGRRNAQRRERAHAADTEHAVLRQTRVTVPDVEPTGDPAIDWMIVGAVGVEQIERHAPDVDPPDLDVHDPTAHDDIDGERLIVRSRDAYGGQVFEVVPGPPFVLQPGKIETLVKIPFAVEEPDSHQRDGQIGGRLQHVTGQHSEAAAVE